MWKPLNGNVWVSKVKKHCQELFELFSIPCAFAGSKSTQSFLSGDAKQQIKSRPKQRPVTPRPQRFISEDKKGTTGSGWFGLKYSSRQQLFTQCFVFVHSFDKLDKLTFTYFLFK